MLVDGEVTYDFDPKRYKPTEIITPLSRSFIPARVEDNPYYMASGYVATLQSLPEPLRSKMLYGDFKAGREDDAYQLIPTAWIEAAQERWRNRQKPTTPLSALGLDVARGGNDQSILAPRYDNYFDELISYPGTESPDGPTVAGYAISARGSSSARVNVDVIGVGSSVYDSLRGAIGDSAVPMNGAEGTDARDKSGQLGFINCRAEWHWKFREALDPTSGQDLALPDDRELKADLCTPRWKLTARGIQIESKDDIKKRIGRSPDKGDAVINAHATKHMPGAGWLGFFARQAAESRLTPDWSRIPAEIDAGQVDALVKEGMAEMRDAMGIREWRRKLDN